MSVPRIVVIGAGAAGTAAAWRAARAGATVTVIHGASGASALYSGTADVVPWERELANEPVSVGAGEFVRALGLWKSGDELARIATRAGIVRPARAADRALLDLSAFAGRRIAVADVDRDDWDAPLLARSLASSHWARSTGTDFIPVRVSAIRAGHERRYPATDFARLFDDPERARWLGEQLESSRTAETAAWLTGPWLGLERDVPSEIAARAGVAVGETTSLPGGVAGARFEVARDRLFAALGVTVVRARAERLTPTSEGVRISTSSETVSADVTILALGGLIGGGVRATSGEFVLGAIAFELSLEVPGVEIALTTDLDASVGCDIGERFELLNRVGIRMDGPRVRGLPRTFAAGDVCNGGAHTVLGAVDSGIAAADAALRDLAD